MVCGVRVNSQECRSGPFVGDLTPNRCVVGCFRASARPGVDIARDQAVGGGRRKQYVIDTDALIVLPAPGLIIPESVGAGPVRVQSAKSVRQSQIDDAAE